MSNFHITAIAPYRVFPAASGGQKGIVLFYEALAEKVPVTLTSTRNNEVQPGAKFEQLYVMGNSQFRYINPFNFISIRKIIAERKSTHLFIEHPYIGWLGLLLKIFCKVKLVVHSHNIESTRFKTMGKWWWGILWNYEKFVHRNSDINFFVTGEDRQYAIDRFGLKSARCHVIPYGMNVPSAPPATEKIKCRDWIIRHHQLAHGDRLLFFNGMLDYYPNIQALENIIQHINPLLLEQKGFFYKIIICGKNLPAKYDGLKAYRSQNIIYAGFVDDLSIYYKGCEMFINPVLDGGGIKTKLVEALGYDLLSISTTKGAYGVPAAIAGNRLKIITGSDWHDFTNAIVTSNPANSKIDDAFYQYFQWKNIAAKAVETL